MVVAIKGRIDLDSCSLREGFAFAIVLLAFRRCRDRAFLFFRKKGSKKLVAWIFCYGR